jgi:hypothetical protein
LVARGYLAYGGALFGVAVVWTAVMAATLALSRGRPD